MKDFLNKIASVLEVESVGEADKLTDFEQLDSLGVLSLIAMLDANYGVNISTADIDRTETVADLWKCVQHISLKNSLL